MQCECGEREATIHEVVIVNGEVRETHLCESCALERGIQVHPHAPVSSLVSKGVASGTMKPARVRGACQSCGMSFDEFRKGGHVGCADCYENFGERLSGLLERAQQGAGHHVGKVPARKSAEAKSRGDESIAGSETDRSARIAEVQNQLDRAIRGEQYERAALLRDELRRLSGAGDDP